VEAPGQLPSPQIRPWFPALKKTRVRDSSLIHFNQSISYKQKDQAATYIAVKYTAYNEANMTLGINSHGNLIT